MGNNGRSSSVIRKMKELTDSRDGVFKLNAEDKDIKVAAVDEVWFNFMRRH